MQAGRGRAARVAGRERAEHGAAGDGVAGSDRDRDRLVGGTQAAGMVDRHDAPAGQHAGVDHHSRAGGEHRLARHTGKVHPAVARPVRVGRRIEPPCHDRPPRQRPSPAPDVTSSRPRRAGHGRPTRGGRRGPDQGGRRAQRAGQREEAGRRGRPGPPTGRREEADRRGRPSQPAGAREEADRRGRPGQLAGRRQEADRRGRAGPGRRGRGRPGCRGGGRGGGDGGDRQGQGREEAVPPRAAAGLGTGRAHGATVGCGRWSRGGGMSHLWMERGGVDSDLALLGA
jgi:hypothetical protein